MGQPLVSVVMNCYNSATYLKEAIESVFAQSYGNWEIIFWDNASTDSSPEIAQSFGSKLKYYRGESNVSLGEARNLALAKASGEFIAFLDCDDLWLPQKLEKQLPLFNDPEVGLVYSDAIYFNSGGDSSRLYQSRPYYTGRCFSQLLTDYCLCLQSVVIRRECLEGLQGWFDNDFNLIEEVDVFIRISHDWKLTMVPEPLAKWRVHSTSSTWKHGTRFAGEFDLMLTKYAVLYPGFESKYQREVRLLQEKNTLSLAMFHWRDGRGDAARQSLKPLLEEKKLKPRLLYLASFFPEYLVVRLLKPFRKTKVVPSN